jgi:hypothetical protein
MKLGYVKQEAQGPQPTPPPGTPPVPPPDPSLPPPMTEPPPPIPIPNREQPGGPQPIDDPPRYQRGAPAAPLSARQAVRAPGEHIGLNGGLAVIRARSRRSPVGSCAC